MSALVQEDDVKMEYFIYYTIWTFSVLELQCSHDEKLIMVIILYVQKLHHYIFLRTKNVIANSNPIQYILGRQLLSRKFARWFVILQEYDLESTTPKSKKAHVVVKLINTLPRSSISLPLNDQFLDEHLFQISSNDPWYGGILT